jgi:hypothetical protein
LNAASLNGLSFDTRGREWLRSTPRSSRSWATGLEVIEVPRSAWIASGMPWTPIASSSMVLAISESSTA